MAKKTKRDSTITLEFPRIGNPWIDAGVVGLYRVLQRQSSFLEDVPITFREDTPGSAAFPNVTAGLEAERLVVAGPKDELQRCLELAYDCLISCYYNLSTQRQRADRKTWNFYFDTQDQKFKTFPKRRAAGASLLLFDKAVRPAASQEKWGTPSGAEKPTPGVLSKKFAHLQPALNQLLDEYGMKPGPPAGLLIDGENEVRPKIKIQVSSRNRGDVDFLVGAPMPGASIAKNTAFPLFGGSRSFVNQTSNDPRIGWQVDYVGKFTPAVSFYYTQGNDLYIYFPVSSDLRRAAEVADRLARVCEADPNLFRNFQLMLGGYFAGRSEVTFAFLHRVFLKLSEQQNSKPETAESSSHDEDEEVVFGASGASDAEEAGPQFILAEAIFDALLRETPVNFAVVAARKKGNVWMGREFYAFTESLYLARLLAKMTDVVSTKTGASRVVCNPKSLMHALIDFEAAKDKTLLREQVCEAILSKRSVLRLFEQHAFSLFTQWSPGGPLMIRPLLEFVTLYEPELHEDVNMDKSTYEEMVNRATWLGRNIANGVASAGEGSERNESAGRSKGVFFRLRRARKIADFQEELIRLQMRYDIDIPPKALDADCFNEQTFDLYRGFCVLAALNRYQYLSNPKRRSEAAAPAKT